jgi:hypothetical protein
MMLTMPDNIDLSEFFGTLPQETDNREGYLSYQVMDNGEIELIFSCQQIDSSIQFIFNFRGFILVTILGELASHMKIEKDKVGKYLVCHFEYGGASTKAVLRIEPRISLRFSTLRQ